MCDKCKEYTMSDTEATLIKQRCKADINVWNDMITHNPNFTNYIEQLPNNFNSGETIKCSKILKEVFEDLLKWVTNIK